MSVMPPRCSGFDHARRSGRFLVWSWHTGCLHGAPKSGRRTMQSPCCIKAEHTKHAPFRRYAPFPTILLKNVYLKPHHPESILSIQTFVALPLNVSDVCSLDVLEWLPQRFSKVQIAVSWLCKTLCVLVFASKEKPKHHLKSILFAIVKRNDDTLLSHFGVLVINQPQVLEKDHMYAWLAFVSTHVVHLSSQPMISF